MSFDGVPAWKLRPSVDAHRLRWLVQDAPMEESVHVLDEATDANSPLKPYKSASGELQPIHTSSVSIAPRKELTVTIPDLENYILYDEFPEDHSVYDDEHGRPYDEPTCEIKASNGEYITIGEFIDAVYPWLVSLRGRYIEDAPVPGYEWGDDVQLWVQPSSRLGGIRIQEAEPPVDHPEARNTGGIRMESN
ncbi:hypothetical protein K4F52_002468 [Lecanicillium sp. MT-2017a]|nr:hypothetical protein K4F52_002468 [Lecanicillium sp. MT-2017a]